MHDCFGKSLRPFDRVRAATKEELEARTPPDPSGVEPLSPTEKIVLSGNPSSTTCNVLLADHVGWPAISSMPGPGGIASFAFEGSVQWATAHKLVRLD